MPSRVLPARRGTLARDSARRQAVDVLRIGEAVASYAAASIANGLSPDDARRAALDAAAELAELASALRRLVRLDLDPVQRAALAVELAASGLSQRQVAEHLGVSKKTVWSDLRKLSPTPVLTCAFAAPYLEARTTEGTNDDECGRPARQLFRGDARRGFGFG